jgi:hypothetical protein
MVLSLCLTAGVGRPETDWKLLEQEGAVQRNHAYI